MVTAFISLAVFLMFECLYTGDDWHFRFGWLIAVLGVVITVAFYEYAKEEIAVLQRKEES
jgi:hypothetical protein